MVFKVEHGIEIPAETRPNARLYPFGDMQPGDSFFVPAKDAAERMRRRQSVAAAARKFATTSGEPASMTFHTRQTPDGIRCWRTA
ncbi:hypothetical protein [Parvibaculum sp.]|uniref:DUF7303 family protein n=1 Tax=Parvibaculum sp. TaxID=2024848 RepID=UPI00273683F8|nr:hypothetical protein [Parvibaculum sp.]MDP3327718.1 hypothetical protein [Parvibaculum sp.]